MNPRESKIRRFSISLPQGLLRQLDRMVRKRGFDSRSQAIAEIVRRELAEHERDWGNTPLVGTISLVFDHHKHGIQKRLTDAQHKHLGLIIANTHVHLDHPLCLEVLLVRGPGRKLKKLADELLAVRGIKTGRLHLTTADKDLEQTHRHSQHESEK